MYRYKESTLAAPLVAPESTLVLPCMEFNGTNSMTFHRFNSMDSNPYSVKQADSLSFFQSPSMILFQSPVQSPDGD